jgi:lipoprotein-anchoring transpeptidase ErfK/SrfK
LWQLALAFQQVRRPGKKKFWSMSGSRNFMRSRPINWFMSSKTYGSPMPYSMFFSKDGKAIHGTGWAILRSYLHAYITESVGSMGCVGLTEEDAKAIYEWTPKGTLIVVLEGKSHEEKRLEAYQKAGEDK